MNTSKGVTLKSGGPATVGGIAAGVAANALWASAMVAPLVLPQVSPVLLTVGRYLALGAACLVIACFLRLPRIGWSGWGRALVLGVTGNVGYYAILAAAMQLSLGPPAIIILATLPVVVAVAGNLRRRAIAWRSLLPALVITALGVGVVNAEEFVRASRVSSPTVGWGILLAVVAVAVWTLYAVANSAFLRDHPEVSATQWSTVVGITGLPLALLLLPVALGDTAASFGQWPALVMVSFFLGVVVSWGGTLLWNRAAATLPDALAGQLIVFESVIAMLLALLITGTVPSLLQFLGYATCLLGILLTVHVASRAPARA